ncbi:uncharacterized protein LOC128723809 [Anopheles nili]|uniref:uncharacterized protein LOC128723809 n=1 Tax=Anopheles nili TaxID=185578 RepID=UPI00237A913A|nr:uncharacterized protein LOC128723809 [Anopheles nili]
MNLERELKELKAVIRSLLISHTNQRMTIAELQGDFQRNEGCPIPFAKFGYDSVLKLLKSLPDVVQVCFTSFSNVWQWVSMMNVPVNSVKLSSTIAKVRASDYFTIAENEIVSIMYILNPNRIWLRSVKQDQIISKLQREMNQFYNNIGSKYLCLEASKALHGLYCAVLYQDYWYRARIVGPLVGRRIKVNFIDIGIVELVELGNMKFLADIFDAIPAQAIRGSLAYLMPPSNAWNIETSEALSYLLTFEDFLSAYVVNIDHDLNTVDVVLHNKRGDIINKYFASIISAHWTGDNYLSQKLEDYQRRNRTFNERYPTFFCIEDGHYPTRCEILDAYKSNIYFEEFYTHITHVEGNNIVEQISKLTNEKMAQTFGIEIHKHPTEDKIYESD